MGCGRWKEDGLCGRQRRWIYAAVSVLWRVLFLDAGLLPCNLPRASWAVCLPVSRRLAVREPHASRSYASSRIFFMGLSLYGHSLAEVFELRDWGRKWLRPARELRYELYGEISLVMEGGQRLMRRIELDLWIQNQSRLEQLRRANNPHIDPLSNKPFLFFALSSLGSSTAHASS